MAVYRVKEAISLVHIDSDTHLTRQDIRNALLKAYTNYMYAKFYTDKYYIQVNFMRDGTTNVASNIRNPVFTNSLYQYSKGKWTILHLTEFIYYWMQTRRRSIS